MKKNSLKKVVTIFLTLTALLVSSLPVCAAVIDDNQYEIQWTYISETCHAFLYEDEENGILYLQGSTIVPYGYNAYVKVELQKYSGGWTTIHTWEDEGHMGGGLEDYYTLTESGSYRLKLTHEARNKTTSATLESFTDYSRMLTY